MKKLIVMTVLAAFAAGVLGGCDATTMNAPGNKPLAGASMGALGGAGIGALVDKKNPLAGAAIGGVAGGALGYGAGKQMEYNQQRQMMAPPPPPPGMVMAPAPRGGYATAPPPAQMYAAPAPAPYGAPQPAYGGSSMNNTQKGVVGGALGGAAIGALVNKKDRGKGALVGGLGGAALGGIVGNQMDKNNAAAYGGYPPPANY